MLDQKLPMRIYFRKRSFTLAWAFLVLGALSAQQACATSVVSGPDDALTFTINIGPLAVSAPERFQVTGYTSRPSRSNGNSPGRLEPVIIDQPGDFVLTLPSESTVESRRYYSLDLLDRSKTPALQYTLRFELLSGTCAATAAVSNNVQLLAVAGRTLIFSVLRRPAGRANGPQLISTPKTICINPEAVARLMFDPLADDLLPMDIETEDGAYASVTELVIPL